jgi:hypothetical protein
LGAERIRIAKEETYMSDEPKPPHELTDPAAIGGFGREGVSETDQTVKEGKAAEHQWGIQYQGSFESATDGTARAVRLHAEALSRAGIPVLLQSFTNSFVGPDGVRIGAEAMDDDLKKQLHHLRYCSVGELRLRVKHMVISSAEELRAYIIPNSVSFDQDTDRLMRLRDGLYRSTIVYSVWERDRIDDSIASILRRVGECWVPCQANAALLRRHGIERVVVVPHPWETTSDMAKLVRRRPVGDKRFYAIGSWQPRKHFHETIGAFLIAFKPTDRATLTIKTSRHIVPGYPSPSASVMHWLEDARVKENGWTAQGFREKVTLALGTLSADQLLKLHYLSNIYVCASRGEAFCLPAFDAKVAGNRMLLVGFNGALDFSAPDDPLIPYEMKPVPKEYGWEADAMWAEASVEDIAEAMRNVEAPAEHVRPKALEACTMESVGELMRSRVEAVLARAAGGT